jgi:hypothetical protein
MYLIRLQSACTVHEGKIHSSSSPLKGTEPKRKSTFILLENERTCFQQINQFLVSKTCDLTSPRLFSLPTFSLHRHSEINLIQRLSSCHTSNLGTIRGNMSLEWQDPNRPNLPYLISDNNLVKCTQNLDYQTANKDTSRSHLWDSKWTLTFLFYFSTFLI